MKNAIFAAVGLTLSLQVAALAEVQKKAPQTQQIQAELAKDQNKKMEDVKKKREAEELKAKLAEAFKNKMEDAKKEREAKQEAEKKLAKDQATKKAVITKWKKASKVKRMKEAVKKAKAVAKLKGVAADDKKKIDIKTLKYPNRPILKLVVKADEEDKNNVKWVDIEAKPHTTKDSKKKMALLVDLPKPKPTSQCRPGGIINGAVGWASEALGIKCRGVQGASTLMIGALTATFILSPALF